MRAALSAGITFAKSFTNPTGAAARSPRSQMIRGSRHSVKLKGNEYVPPPASEDGNRHDSILFRMQLSASDAPGPFQVRFVMFTPVTSPLPVSEIATVTVPASDGLDFRPYS